LPTAERRGVPADLVVRVGPLVEDLDLPFGTVDPMGDQPVLLRLLDERLHARRVLRPVAHPSGETVPGLRAEA
jgi:hypothetical protein